MMSAWLLIALSALPVGAQQTRTFAARLSPVPITVAMQSVVAGRGAAKATLTGNKLTVEGTFEGCGRRRWWPRFILRRERCAVPRFLISPFRRPRTGRLAARSN